MTDQPDISKESSYDQKAFTQLRLNELFMRIDRLNTNPLLDWGNGLYSYQIIFQDLCSVFTTIYSKLTPKEKEDGKATINKLKEIVSIDIYLYGRNIKYNLIKRIEPTKWNLVRDSLFNFRCLLEDLMDIHGFNPSKDDVGKSIMKM